MYNPWKTTIAFAGFLLVILIIYIVGLVYLY